MRSLPLLVVLLFAVVVRATAAPTLMEELLANGAPQRIKTCGGLYLTEELPKLKGGFLGLGYRLGFWALPRQELLQGWTFEQINDKEVAIKSSLGNYIEHGGSGYALDSKDTTGWEMVTPMKNPDGSWSFTSRWNKYWLTADSYHSLGRHFLMFLPEKSSCGYFLLEPYTPPVTPPLMAELLANGGRRRFKSHNGLYLTFRERAFYKRNELVVTIKGPRCFVSHSDYDQGRPAYEVDTWEMLTPMKNDDGTWSFKSRWDKWLSGGGYREGQVHFMPENKRCERWTLQEW
ncbi:hypothetical protein PRIPAC_79347 [Pristionchus pacificus]|uniref:Uncharacterized protein n=1 Tax=Pristionchus pacificus TaxID=54126 RepID=A0A2A6BXZ5_PRIPA|nr:hypothetical protein PRIPAC_79347 [Pristionchus pacificus]|eukprot:PDM70739.1 hypothetical protein PRIPAC_44943 [Pristionchus pacificus]